MKQKKLYIIEFNRSEWKIKTKISNFLIYLILTELTTKFHESRLNNAEVGNPGHFMAEQSYFNFHSDQIEVNL